MRFVLLFTVLCLLTTSCIYNRIAAPITIDGSKMVIDLQKGFDSITLGQTTFKEIESILGKGGRIKIRHKARTFENWLLPNFVYFLSYPDAGIVFKTYYYPRLKLPRVVEEILLTDDFKGQTKEGVKIGMSYSELKSKLNVHSLDFMVNYEGPDYTSCCLFLDGSFVVFYCYKRLCSEEEFVVEEIEIRYSS